jgi:hypothetical protein
VLAVVVAMCSNVVVRVDVRLEEFVVLGSAASPPSMTAALFEPW